QYAPAIAATGNGSFVVDWQGNGVGDDAGVFMQRYGGPLFSAAGPITPASQTLSATPVKPLLNQAIAAWQLAGADASALRNLDIRVADLGGTRLGIASGHTITLDDNAAGWGWNIPISRSEMTAVKKMDLLTALEHEIGHLLGREHETDGVMSATLA